MLKARLIDKQKYHCFNYGNDNYINKSDYQFAGAKLARSKPTYVYVEGYGECREVDYYYTDGINRKKASHFGLINKDYEHED